MNNLIKILFPFIFIIFCTDVNHNPVGITDVCSVVDCDNCLVVHFTKENYSDSQNCLNQDCIVDDICLTRGDSGALFNASLYNSYNEVNSL